MITQQTTEARRRRKILIKRWVIFIFWITAFIVGTVAWLLSSGRIIPSEWTYGLSALLLFCGLVLSLGAWLFPLRPTKPEISGVNSLSLVRDLRPESLKLGDNYAANFPYVIVPLQSIYNDAIQALQNVSTDTTRAKRGILIIGESNSGKTRLAFEILKRTLPTWPVLRWPGVKEGSDLMTAAISSKDLLVFIDDLHDYVSMQISMEVENDINAMRLRTLLEALFQSPQCVVVVATCRAEDKLRVQAVLNWLFDQLTVITMPRFSADSQDPQAKQVSADFQKQGDIHIKDWDGTVGSLVLGLTRKKEQYLRLKKSQPSATTVLKAMKLLTKANITEHTELRVRSVCADIFGEEDLQRNDVWREAMDHLTSLQFITVEDSGPQSTLIVRKDVYFDKVVVDYPPENLPHQIERDFKLLSTLLAELNDAIALSNLSIALSNIDRHKEAMTVCEQAISINPQNGHIWTSKAYLLSLRGRYKEALAIFDRILSEHPQHIQTLSNKGKMLRLLKNYKEALAVFDRTITISPKNAEAWLNKGCLLEKMERHEEALAALEHTLTLDPNNAHAWRDKGKALKGLKRHDEAVTAFEHALALEPNNADSWLLKGHALLGLNHYEDALTAFERALTSILPTLKYGFTRVMHL